jgi:acyl-CoA thioester hydrolase
MVDLPYERSIEVRFRDLDPMKHVNNAVYASYLEQARASYFADVVGERLEDIDTVLANLEINYRRPIEADHSVTIALGVDELGTSSIPIDYEVRIDDADGETAVAATAETVQVLVDREAGTARPLPDAWRERIANWNAA